MTLKRFIVVFQILISIMWSRSSWSEEQANPSVAVASTATTYKTVNFKVPVQVHGVGRFNPILQELVRAHGLDAALMNPATAARKGIREGDEVWIETLKGRRVKSVLGLSERVHPEVVATIQHGLTKGADFNSLISLDRETMDFVGCAVDSCLLVKVYRT